MIMMFCIPMTAIMLTLFLNTAASHLGYIWANNSLFCALCQIQNHLTILVFSWELPYRGYMNFLFVFTARYCDCMSSVRLSVRLFVCLSVITLVDQDHIGWKSWKLIARTIRPNLRSS